MHCREAGPLKLVAIPLTEHEAWAKYWLPFLPRIARRSYESVTDLFGQIMRREVRLVLVMDGDKAVALVGVSIRQIDGKSYGDMIWLAGFGRKQWQELLPEFEQMLRDAGCVCCRPICRPGWMPFLKTSGYKLTHVMMEKVL